MRGRNRTPGALFLPLLVWPGVVPDRGSVLLLELELSVPPVPRVPLASRQDCQILRSGRAGPREPLGALCCWVPPGSTAVPRESRVPWMPLMPPGLWGALSLLCSRAGPVWTLRRVPA